ncbi:hypothetical protein EST38_g2693 [Candolleomyces aberdarensis]|uniref:T6SS Phospholipase effector Tle1-like catalytic domain-containing protein n=1 Tax=Candolleomyces aberdarensis TaxID=2316362 RepID=A0A4Q2DTZ6_9AGAR|nr:hypothetical protein EST38_g2693 [Candolleomyces aberdarensis]
MTAPTKDTQHYKSVSFDATISGLPTTSQSPLSIKTTFEDLQGRQSSIGPDIPAIPEDRKRRRTLVLCFDGTGDQFDADNSNIVEFFSTLSKGDPDNQMVYYQAGIGTYTGPRVNLFLHRVSKILDEAIAWNLGTHIMDGYEFLMQNYRANDRICIFGFSRGAYTARCLAGMIHKVGLLPACNHQQVPFAYKMYKRPDELGWKQSNAFKKAFSIDVEIEFLGVWDTVNSVGIIPRRLPFTTSNTIVRTFRHAIALDERRAKFKANTWNRPVHGEPLLSITDQKAAKKAKQAKKAKDKKKAEDHKGCLHNFESRYSTIRDEETDVEEVSSKSLVFAHIRVDIALDVGGGSVTNETRSSLARIALRWMIRECFKRETGIIFKVEGLRDLGMDPASLYPVVLPRPPPVMPEPKDLIKRIPKVQPTILIHGDDASSDDDPFSRLSEEHHDLLDALSPKYDQLALKKTWWFGEFLPMTHRYQQSNNEWTKTFKWNMGQGRIIPRQKIQGAKIHRSVQARMEAAYEDGKKYVPKVANLDMDKVIWVD